MKRFLLTFLMAFVFALPAEAADQIIRYFTSHYDLDSATTTYCYMDGPHDGSGTVTSVGTTVTGSADDSFTPLKATDSIVVFQGVSGDSGGKNVTAVASGTSMTIRNAPTVAYAADPWVYYQLNCGTAVTDGWVDVQGWTDKTIVVGVEAGASTGNSINVVWECRVAAIDSQPYQVFPDNWPAGVGTAAVTNFLDANVGTKQARRAVRIPEPWSECRVGMIITDDAGDAVPEEVTAYIVGLKEK